MNATLENQISRELDLFIEERRATSRFPFREDVTYKYRHGKLISAGSGKCLNIGSGGVLFTITGSVPVGRIIELSVNWPALLDGACPLKFIATGPIVRVEDHQAAMRIDRYEFRTRATRPGLAASIQELRVG
jgi:hypothetical protein